MQLEIKQEQLSILTDVYGAMEKFFEKDSSEGYIEKLLIHMQKIKADEMSETEYNNHVLAAKHIGELITGLERPYVLAKTLFAIKDIDDISKEYKAFMGNDNQEG